MSARGAAALLVLACAACSGTPARTAAPPPGTAVAVPPPTSAQPMSAQPMSAQPMSAQPMSARPMSASPTMTATPSSPIAPLAGRTVVLDPGHDGGNAAQPARLNALVEAGGIRKACNTTGTETDAGYAEHAFTFDVATRAAALLRAGGATVVLTRPSDTGFGPCIDQRAAIANAAHADAVVSVHADGGPSSGLGFHVIAPALAPDRGNAAILDSSWRLAVVVRDAFHAGTGEPYATYTAVAGLVRRSDLGGLNLARVPAVLIECGNMRNATDAVREGDPAWRQRAAQAITAALLSYLSDEPRAR